jgi:Phage integrase family
MTEHSEGLGRLSAMHGTPTCPRCRGAGWVCEQHPDQPWPHPNAEEPNSRTLRHTALSRMVAAGIDDYTVMAVSGHSSTRMLERYAHPTEARKIDALGTFNLPRVGTI